MASTPTNPNPRNSKNVHHIGGIPVEFPYQPYGSQLAFMGRVISTLDRAQRDGHCHALLESPTGTGKSLSLLCSALAWQQNCMAKGQYANPSQSKPAPEALTDPLAYGGGFIPDTQPTSVAVLENLEPTQSGANNKNQKKKIVPTIYYATRTHSQISQVIREYRKTSYRVPMAVLASRKHYCTNSNLRGKENIDEECKLLLKNQDVGCSEFRNVNKVKGHPSLKKGGCHEVHDIEDLVKVGQVVKGCSYYAARSMAEDAPLVFCPYNYIINPVIRGAMEVDIKGAIVILDEAHNIEDIARDAGSIDLEEDVLHKLQKELEPLCWINAMIYQPLYEMTQDLISWIERKKNTLEKREFQRYCSCWTGDKALRELQEANISQQCFPALLECATKAIKAATDTESDGESDAARLSGMSVITLEGLFSSLTYFFSRNGCHKFDYQLALQRCVRRDARSSMGDWTHTLSLWCLNPAVVFRDVANLSLSVILTSGTLSPMNSFSSELGVQFGTCLEAPHVIDVKTQVWASIISTGPGDHPLNASYKTADGLAFQDALGNTLEEICKIVPGGALVFFPSYKLMEKLGNRWRETGQWSRLNAKKSLFVEPKGGSQDDFEPTLKNYYDSICGGKKQTVRRKGRIKKMDPNHFNVMEPQESDKKGAAFLAVCRGKVSEGIDFSDDNARVVIIVGIPFPNITDIQVSLKKKYNDTYKSSKDLLSGNEWYCHQAFRALNQAAGRCIRHRFDYGAIILLDERFREERNSAYISKWLKKSIRQYESFDLSLESLKSFFSDVKEQVVKNSENVLQNSESIDENISSTNQKQFMREKNQTGNKLDRRKFVSGKKCDVTLTQLNSQGKQTDNMDICNQPNYIDLECNFDKDLRCPGFLSVTSTHEDLEVTIVKETPGIDGSITTASPGSFSKDENSSSSVIQVSTEFPEQFSPQSMSLTDPSRAPSKAQCSMAVTPEKNATANIYSMLPEIESSLNLSVNSHTQKRRKAMGSRLVNFSQAEQFDAPDAKSPGSISFVGSSMASGDSGCRIEYGFENSPVEHKYKKLNLTPLLRMNGCLTSNVSSGPVMDRRLQISCSLCRSLLGRPEKLYVMCSLSLLSKVYLASLLREKSDSVLNMSTGIPVLITDISSVNQQLCNRTLQGEGRGVWCEEDGCVFNAIFCPFCSTCNNCLGVQIMATDALNVQLLNKILFYADHLEIKNFEAPKDQVVTDSGMDKVSALNSIDKFAYSPKQLNSEGWRTTKSKLRLPKRG